jgi:hypothetical protein
VYLLVAKSHQREVVTIALPMGAVIGASIPSATKRLEARPNIAFCMEVGSGVSLKGVIKVLGIWVVGARCI